MVHYQNQFNFNTKILFYPRVQTGMKDEEQIIPAICVVLKVFQKSVLKVFLLVLKVRYSILVEYCHKGLIM